MTDYATQSDWLMWAMGVMERAPDQVIGPSFDPYLRRWFITPRSPHGNVYLHEILRSDDDRALHDHPWDNSSFIIRGGYFEHLPAVAALGDTLIEAGAFWRGEGWTGSRSATQAHRLELMLSGHLAPLPCVSLFITGPKVREWGFHCPQGWRHWQDFAMGPNGEPVGAGCA